MGRITDITLTKRDREQLEYLIRNAYENALIDTVDILNICKSLHFDSLFDELYNDSKEAMNEAWQLIKDLNNAQ